MARNGGNRNDRFGAAATRPNIGNSALICAYPKAAAQSTCRGATTVERRAIRQAATNAGAPKVWLIDEPIAAAIGAGLPVTEPVGAMIGEATAERIKLAMDIAHVPDDGFGGVMRVKGRDLRASVPVEIEVTQGDIGGSLSNLVGQVVETVLTALEKTEPELAADICEHSIVMTGGGSLLVGIDRVLSEATGLPLIIADNALACVALGTGRVLENSA